MTESRPEYIRCIKHNHGDYPNTTWCGEKYSSFDWVFQDIDHATYTAMDGGRLVPCPDCLNAIFEVLKND
jgi:hypothetical protein